MFIHTSPPASVGTQVPNSQHSCPDCKEMIKTQGLATSNVPCQDISNLGQKIVLSSFSEVKNTMNLCLSLHHRAMIINLRRETIAQLKSEENITHFQSLESTSLKPLEENKDDAIQVIEGHLGYLSEFQTSLQILLRQIEEINREAQIHIDKAEQLSRVKKPKDSENINPISAESKEAMTNAAYVKATEDPGNQTLSEAVDKLTKLHRQLAIIKKWHEVLKNSPKEGPIVETFKSIETKVLEETLTQFDPSKIIKNLPKTEIDRETKALRSLLTRHLYSIHQQIHDSLKDVKASKTTKSIPIQRAEKMISEFESKEFWSNFTRLKDLMYQTATIHLQMDIETELTFLTQADKESLFTNHRAQIQKIASEFANLDARLRQAIQKQVDTISEYRSDITTTYTVAQKVLADINLNATSQESVRKIF